jgi:hypothetical protein
MLLAAAMTSTIGSFSQAAEADHSPAKIQNLMRETTGFVLGFKGPEIGLFMDPNSARSHTLYEELVPIIARYRLRVYAVPVGYIKAGSLSKAAAEMAAPNVQAAIAKNEHDFNAASGEGGGPGLNVEAVGKRRAAEALTMTKRNNHVLKSLGEMETPLVVWEMHGEWREQYRPNGAQMVHILHIKFNENRHY